ncbi:MAG: YjbQ family protein, partial [Pirellulales bacterium]|nr:YjbQ family protein [Pirellulales bacterium]
MPWIQRTIELLPHSRGFHLITRQVVEALPELAKLDVGLLHVFIQHTSASVAINENADPDVPADLETSLNSIAPENFPYEHTVTVHGLSCGAVWGRFGFGVERESIRAGRRRSCGAASYRWRWR